MNIFKAFFGTLSHHLIEGLRSWKIWQILLYPLLSLRINSGSKIDNGKIWIFQKMSLETKNLLNFFLGSKIDIIKFALFSNFWGPQSNYGSRYQKIPWTCLLDYKSLLNFTCLIMKFHNRTVCTFAHPYIRNQMAGNNIFAHLCGMH